VLRLRPFVTAPIAMVVTITMMTATILAAG
jgi:hypothetical protein